MSSATKFRDGLAPRNTAMLSASGLCQTAQVFDDPGRIACCQPHALFRVKQLGEGKEEILGVDISFQNLSLAVNVGGSAFNVVDGVTGRIRGKTMTALMGGSGAGT